MSKNGKDIILRMFKHSVCVFGRGGAEELKCQTLCMDVHLIRVVRSHMHHKMGHLVGKTNNVVSDQVRHKPTCTVTEKS